MSQPAKIDFVAFASVSVQMPPQAVVKRAGKTESAQTLVIFAGADFAFGPATRQLLGAEGEALIKKAAAATKFKGKALTALDIVAPAGFAADRLLVIGAGASGNEPEKAGKAKNKQKEPEAAQDIAQDAAKDTASEPDDFVTMGGYLRGKLGAGAFALVVFDL